ncbi:RNA polymerase sigma-70 factor [Olivibacter sp. CPCC 100613]|uniref:RNA polymerase sigma-70 factor n=1 Tax=Olivibacter sp. CPCC 100613 TaxID=3079931 RepID=UPI002FF85E8A
MKSFSLGNVEAFNSIYSQYKPKVFNYALKFVKDKDEAEEISQDIFVRLWKYRSSTDPEKDFDAFIYTVARNVIFKEFKRKLRETSYLAEQSNCIVENYDPIDSYINLKEYKEFASKAIDSLPPQAKKVFKLSREEGQSYECIASKLAISPSTVHNHMTKSLRHIRKYFDYHIPETILFCILLTKAFFR